MLRSYSSGVDLGNAGALLTTLHLARYATPWLADLALADHAASISEQRLADAETTLCFVMTLALVCIGAVSWNLVRRRTAYPALDIVVVVFAVALGVAGSWPLGCATLLAVVLLAPLLSSALPPEHHAEAGSSLTPAVVLIASELLALGWGTWNASRPRDLGVALAVASATLAVAWVALLWPGPTPRRDRAVRLAVAGSPLLLGALLGVAGEPHPEWVAVTSAVAVGIAVWLGSRPVTTPLTVARLAFGAVPVAWITIAITPVAMRSLPRANHYLHEACHAGWIEGALHGRFFQADIDTVYGLLREWILTGYLLVAGLTLENLRVASVLVNIAGAALLIAVVFRYLRNQTALTIAFAYALVLYTPLRCLVYYETHLSLGWVDLVRIGLAVFGLLGSLRTMQSLRPEEHLPGRTVAWGCVLGLATLYSQEFGITAIAATWTTYLASLVFERGAWPGRAVVLRTLLAHSMGIAAVLLATLAIYAAFGKGRLLLETSLLMTRLMAAGDIASEARFPVRAESFLEPLGLWTTYTGKGRNIGNFDAEFLLAPAAYVVALASLAVGAATRTWNAGRTMELALVTFGIVTYRITLSRPDAAHVLSTLAPALLLGVLMADRFLRAETPLGNSARRVALAVVACGFVLATELHHGLVRHGAALAAARSATAPPVLLSRAGHIVVEGGLVKLVHYIQENSTPADAIFVRMNAPGLDGAHIYFLADRRMPTRFAMTQELWTGELRDEAYDSILRDPPGLVVGVDETIIGPRIARYLRQNYKRVWSAGKWTVFARRDVPRPLAAEGTQP